MHAAQERTVVEVAPRQNTFEAAAERKLADADADFVVADRLLTESNTKDNPGQKNPIHKSGPTDCPFYYNEECDVASLVNRLRISRGSRAFLLKSLPEGVGREATLEAFDALLGAFDDQLPDDPADARKAVSRHPPSATRRSKRTQRRNK